ITVIFVPLCMSLGFSTMATVAIVGTAGALGDAGSPASDSTLGPTAGLNADGQHDHIRGSVIPTFIHYNIPLLLAGWIAALVLLCDLRIPANNVWLLHNSLRSHKYFPPRSNILASLESS